MAWSDLPPELLVTIVGDLTELPDHLRFRSVCFPWRSAAISLPVPPQLPYLLLPSPPSSTSRHFYSLSEDRVYTIPLLDAASSNLFGSANGHLLALKGRTTRISASLINPFIGTSIRLPSPNPGSSLSYAGVETLAWDQSPSIVLASCNTRKGLFYTRSGDPSWTQIESLNNLIVRSITYHEGNFYILEDDTCKITVLDGQTLELVSVIEPPELESPVEAHLVVSSHDLLLVVKSTWMYLFPYGDLQFSRVLRLDRNDELYEWSEVADIGDRALLIDDLHCFTIDAGMCNALRRNCIYFASANSASPRSSGSTKMRTYSISVFDLGNRSCEKLSNRLGSFWVQSSNGCPFPSWIVPVLG